MKPVEIRNAVRQLVVKNRFQQAVERLLKWANDTANDWVASEAIRLLEDLDQLPNRDHVMLADRIFALAECVVTGGYPEIGGNENPDLSGGASHIEFGGASEVSAEMSSMTDHFAEISEGMPPPSPAKTDFSGAEPLPQKTSSRPPKNSGGFPIEKVEKMPTMSSKSKPTFSAKPPEIAASTAVVLPEMVAPTPVLIPTQTPPQMGGLLYNIPSKMRQNEDTTCIVRIAFDKNQLKTADDTFSEEVVKEVRIARLMEVELENEGTEEIFKIVAKSDTQQSLDSFEATEWRFAVRPLVSGQQSLLLKVTIIETDANGKETRKTRVLEEEISIATEKVKKTALKSEKISEKKVKKGENTEGGQQGFLSADLKLKDLKTLLFMGANPSGTRVLQLEIEHSRIATKINNRFRIEVEKFLSAAEIPELIVSKSPAIIHFSGHGKDPDSNEKGESEGATRAIGKLKNADSTGGIVVFDNDMRGLKVVDNDALDFMFQTVTSQFNIPIEVVVFNSCYSESQARVIGKYVPYVVGSARAIADDVAIAFASGFYFGISQGFEVEKAFSLGKTQAVFADKNAKDLIVLYKKGNRLNI
jgi:hypothetical protein